MEIVRLTRDGVEPEASFPDPSKVISGTPAFRTWMSDERPPIYAGLWEATPGKWRISYDEWEYCRILSGVSVVVSDDGGEWRLGAGDSFILQPGFKGTWEVVETTLKEFVVVT